MNVICRVKAEESGKVDAVGEVNSLILDSRMNEQMNE